MLMLGLDTVGWIGLAAAVVAILGAAAAYARFLVQAPLIAKNAKLDAERAQVDTARADLQRQLEHARERFSDLEARFQQVNQNYTNLKLDKGGAILKNEIEQLLADAMGALGVKESSILVPGPGAGSSRFVFLAIYGPAAGKLRKAKLPIDQGIAGWVLKTGTIHNSANAINDPNFFAGIDKRAGHETRTLLALPLQHNHRTIGVVQFLNKPGGFTREDEVEADALTRPLEPKVATFISDAANFELLGLAWRSENREATIAFCDLTCSSSLLELMNAPSAIDCINEYLEQQCAVAISLGATIDKYIGDGVMLRFNVPHPIAVEDHAVRAAQAAIEMRDGYARLREGWLSSGLPVEPIYSRIGLACGTVYESTIGHPQFKQITVIGEAVNQAANLCEQGRRDGNVILVDAALADRVKSRFILEPARNMQGTHELLRPK